MALASRPWSQDHEHVWRVDFHALRDTFGTRLAASGATPFVLKELMRHNTVQQSEKYYIDARQMPFAAALATLPKSLSDGVRVGESKQFQSG